MKQAELDKLKKLQKDLRLGKKISESDADSYYDLLDSLGGLSLARAGDSYCLCNEQGVKIESTELITKTFQPMITRAEAAINMKDNSNESSPPPYSANDQQPYQNQGNTQTSQTAVQTSGSSVEQINFNNNSNFQNPAPNFTANTSNCEKSNNLPSFMLPQFKSATPSHSPELNLFLSYVAENCPRMAKKMLQTNPGLALMHGNVRNLANQEFENITAFQYAIWAHNFHMSFIIGTYLSDNERQSQSQKGEGVWVAKHGQYNLLKYQTEYTRWTRMRELQTNPAGFLHQPNGIEEYTKIHREIYKMIESSGPIAGVLIEAPFHAGGGYHQSFYLGKPEEAKRMAEEEKAASEFHNEFTKLAIPKQVNNVKLWSQLHRCVYPETSYPTHKQFIDGLLSVLGEDSKKTFAIRDAFT